MSKINRILIILLLQMALVGSALAQNVTVRVPSQVSVGENFRLSYVVNTQDVENFRAGNIPEGLEVITGPYTSRSSSIQIINGHTTSSSTITFTYTLYAAKNGTYTIPPAKAVIGGKAVQSQSAKVVVSGQASQQQGRQQPRMHNDAQEDMRQAGTSISGNDLFIRVSANKKRVHEQEPILLTYKVYTQVDLTQLEGKMPDLTGFHTQEIPLPQQKSFSVENVDGKPYKTVTWSQYVMFPQMTGKLEIPSITFKGIVVQRVRNIDPFEAFFNGGASYQEVKRDVKAPSVTIQVDPLPERPAGFSGGVGRFSISASADNKEVKAGEPVTVRVVVDGTGNLKLIKQPVLELPKDFDKYDPKVTDKTHLTTNGVEGSMIYDFLIVPRNQGKYTIPAINFVYFDTSSNTYKTVKTEPVQLNVLKGDGKTVVADFAEKDNDIRDVKTGNSSLSSVDDYFFGSSSYLAWLLLPLLFFVVMVILFRRRAAANANVVMMRGKKANKVATKRLRTAVRLMQKGDQNAFYDEVLRALWGYVGDKLSIPVGELSRENINDKLSASDVDVQTISTFIEAIDECEYARFAPGDPQGKMDIVYDKAAKAITDIDSMINTKKKKTGKSFPIVIVFLLLSITASAKVTKQSADAEYAKGNYQEAIRQYNDVLKEGVSADLYYNLGNAYFRTENITQAVLAYERACKLSPGDNDIRFNLQFARSKTIDKITPESEMFFVTWYRSLVGMCSSDVWAVYSVVSFLLMLLMLALYLFAGNPVLIRTGFYVAVVCFMVFVSTAFLSWQQKIVASSHDAAIITAPKVDVRKTPAAGASNEMVLHEGTRVEITDRTMKGWVGIRLSDGREGWILPKQIEEI